MLIIFRCYLIEGQISNLLLTRKIIKIPRTPTWYLLPLIIFENIYIFFLNFYSAFAFCSNKNHKAGYQANRKEDGEADNDGEVASTLGAFVPI